MCSVCCVVKLKSVVRERSGNRVVEMTIPLNRLYPVEVESQVREERQNRKRFGNYIPQEFCVEPVLTRQISQRCTFKSTVRPVWNILYQCGSVAIPTFLSEKIDSIQKRALKIIFPAAESYTDALYLAQLTTLVDRRENLCLK